MENDDRIRLPEPMHSLTEGIERGAVTNFYGPPGAGKTGMCIMAARECIRKGGRVLYIDTEGGLSKERIRQISGTDFDGVMNGMILIEPKDFGEQREAINSLKERDGDMIILDSAVALYRLECADQEKGAMEINKDLSIQLSVLSNIARSRNVPVIITAHTYRNRETGENRIIGGDAIKYWSKSIIFIEPTGKMSERKASIVKHRSMPEGKEARFYLVNEGIRPAKFRII